ncbi:hypothetical protein IAQ61_010262, partial [Plenodomus lingam]|uniref:uncharacterized protein n=1 Tax=Leptosphaeria maculans TaxID=5022 RepID=UPI003319211F
STPPIDLTKIPLLPNPSDAPPNFDDPPTLTNSDFGTGVALIVVSGILLTLRIGTNRKLSNKCGLDDFLCIFAYAGGIAYWVLNLLNGEAGLARHAWDIPLSTLTVAVTQRLTAIFFVLPPSLWAAKAAVLALYIRVFGSVTWLRRTAWIWIVFMALFYGMSIFVTGFYCIPRKGGMWGGALFVRCQESVWLHVVVGVFSAVADLVILIMPFPIVLKLHVSPLKKLTLGLVFGTGIMQVSLVVMSIISLWLRIIVFKGVDTTWNATLLEIVSSAEIFGTIAVSCAPAMSAFWLNIFIKSALWSKLKSSSMFSYLRSWILPLKQRSQERPSFVRTYLARSSKRSQPETESAHDAKHILRKRSYEVLEEERTSSEHQTPSSNSTKE